MMKKSLFLMMLIAVFTVTSCGTMQNVASSSDANAKSMGTTCSTALTGLYKSYKAAGNKVNINDASVLTNVILLSTSTADLKSKAKDANYRKSYIAGMVAGSAGMLDNTKAGAVYDKLVTTSGAISGLNTSSTTSTLTTAANAITTILGLF